MIDYTPYIEGKVAKVMEEIGDGIFTERETPMMHDLVSFIDRFLFLPSSELQLPIIAAYMCSNTAMLRQYKARVPYLYHHGPSGSGKSTVAVLVSLLHDMPIFAADSSAAGIRQELEELNKQNRLCTFLLWDDLNLNSFEGEEGRKKMTILKCGYNPLTGTVTLGGKEGSPLRMDVFGMKIFSSCFPFHASTSYAEVMRRSFVIQHETNSDWVGDSIEEYDFTGCAKRLEELWLPGHRPHLLFGNAFMEIKSAIKKVKLSSAKKELAPALLATGIGAGIWGSTEEAIAHYLAFCDFEAQAYEKKSSFEEWLSSWVLVHGITALSQAQRGHSVHFFSSKGVIEAADAAYGAGEFMEKPTRESISELLMSGRRFGYQLLTRKQSAAYYQEAVWLKEVKDA